MIGNGLLHLCRDPQALGGHVVDRKPKVLHDWHVRRRPLERGDAERGRHRPWAQPCGRRVERRSLLGFGSFPRRHRRRDAQRGCQVGGEAGVALGDEVDQRHHAQTQHRDARTQLGLGRSALAGRATSQMEQQPNRAAYPRQGRLSACPAPP
eukprot:scaffold7031_cov118-Isochrysis_galbana.AAC.4